MKKYGIDGYRIDAVIGNNYLNWRRADFPAVCPPNVDPVWWKKSLEENGGKMPDLQYERASLGCRQGGLQMLKGIRNAVKSNKVDGVILAEVDHAPYMQDADAIFNFPMASTIQKSSTRMPADRWTKILARWLDEGNFVYPKGSRWMQYFGSHDHQNPYHYLGVGAIRTLIGYAMMLDGIPMVYQDQDIGIGVFLKRMIAIRKALPELRRGTGRYASPAPMTLSAFRAYGNNYSVGLANIGPDSVQVRLADAIPEKLSEEGVFVLYSSEKSAPLADGNLTELAAKSVTVPPFSCQVLAFRPSGSASPFSENASKTVYPGMKRQEFSFLEKEDEYIVKSPVYQLTLSRKTGMITGFSDISGKRLFTGSGFITGPSPELQKDIAVENMEVDVIQGKMFVKITAQGNLNNSSPVTLRYLCHPEKVTVEGILEQPQGLPRAGLVFTGNSIDRWQVSSAEGLLDDYFSTRHMKGKPSREKDEGLFYYRMSGTPVMWQSALNPLSFEHPAIAAFSDGKGFEMKFRDLLSCPPDNIALLDKLSRRPGWAVAVYWKDQGPYPFTRKIPETSRFSFDIKPIDEPLEAPATTQWTAVGNVKFRNVSRGWEVDNGIYRLLSQRTGGCIQELQTRSGKVLIDQSHIFTNRGFRRRHSGKNEPYKLHNIPLQWIF